MRFKSHNRGKFWGFGQMTVWIVLIPWLILTIPVDLYFELTTVPPQFSRFFTSWLVDWRMGSLLILNILILIISIGIIRLGWRKMHPEGKVPNIILKNRAKFEKEFSKQQFLASLRKKGN